MSDSEGLKIGVRGNLDFIVSATPDDSVSIVDDIKSILELSMVENVLHYFPTSSKFGENEDLVIRYKGVLSLEDDIDRSWGSTCYSESKKKIEAEVIRIIQKIYSNVRQCNKILVNINTNTGVKIKTQTKIPSWNVVLGELKDHRLPGIYRLAYFSTMHKLSRHLSPCDLSKIPLQDIKTYEEEYEKEVNRLIESIDIGDIDDIESRIRDLVDSNTITTVVANEILRSYRLPQIYKKRDYELTIAISVPKDFPFHTIDVIGRILKSGRALNSIRIENVLSSSEKWITLLYKGIVRCSTPIAVPEIASRLSHQISEKLEMSVNNCRSIFPLDLYEARVIVVVTNHSELLRVIQICSSCARRFQETQKCTHVTK